MKPLRVAVLTLAAVLTVEQAHAQREAPRESFVNSYAAPVVETLAPPEYPQAAARSGEEGWVELNFMVNTEGRPYEILVSRHVGSEHLVEAARQSLENSLFKPARIGDQLVDGSATHFYRFVLQDGENVGRREFGSRYRRFVSKLEGGTRPEIDAALRELEDKGIQNSYEYAFMSLARYNYAERFGTPLEQMKHLEDALGESLASPELDSFLGESATTARRALVQLQVRNRYLGEALDTIELMRLKRDDEGVELFAELSDQIAALQGNDEAYGIAGQIQDGSSWNVKLFKSNFYLDNVAGTVDELKLRCQRSYVFLTFDPETQYKVSDGAGECRLEVIGGLGTTFTLVQM